MEIQKFLDEYVLWNIELSEIPDFAIKLIEEWYESESLYILAWLDPIEWQDIKLYFDKTIIEADLNIKSLKDIYLQRYERYINKKEDEYFYDNFHKKFDNNELLEIFIIIINKYWKKMKSRPYDLTFKINWIEIKDKLLFNENLLNNIDDKKIFIYYLSELNAYSYCPWCTEEDIEYIENILKCR